MKKRIDFLFEIINLTPNHYRFDEKNSLIISKINSNYILYLKWATLVRVLTSQGYYKHHVSLPDTLPCPRRHAVVCLVEDDTVLILNRVEVVCQLTLVHTGNGKEVQRKYKGSTNTFNVVYIY